MAGDFLTLGNGCIVGRSSMLARIENTYEGLNTSRISNMSRPYYSFEVNAIMGKYDVESLDAFWKFNKTDGYFWFAGKDWGRVDDYIIVSNHVDSPNVYLPNRHINPNSFSVGVKYPSSTGVTESTSYNMNEFSGHVSLLSSVSSGDEIVAKYANLYNVRFSDEILIKESLQFRDAYTINFRLVENFQTADPAKFFIPFFLESSGGVVWGLNVTQDLFLQTVRIDDQVTATSVAITDTNNEDWILSVDDDGILYTEADSDFGGTIFSSLGPYRGLYEIDVDSSGLIILNTI